jgi:glutaminyl-peptide cyclotransferase
MDKKILATAAILIVAGVLAAAVVVAWNPMQPSTAGSPVRYTYSILNTYPHDKGAFTEGLVFSNGALFESTGEYGTSSLRLVNLTSGEVLQEFQLPSEYFGEGLTAVDGKLLQLTWQNGIGFVYDENSFDLLGNFSIATEGWGLTYSGINLIMSDGTSKLYFLNPATYEVVGQVSVRDGNDSVTNINELEYINGDVYANIWMTQKIAIINPQTGQIKGWIDLSGIYQSNDVNSVLNGIAYNNQTGGLFVTGKNWPYMYEIEISAAN